MDGLLNRKPQGIEEAFLPRKRPADFQPGLAFLYSEVPRGQDFTEAKVNGPRMVPSFGEGLPESLPIAPQNAGKQHPTLKRGQIIPNH